MIPFVATDANKWTTIAGTWALTDASDRTLAWITKRNCCWYAQLTSDSKTGRSFTHLEDAQRYCEQLAKHGR